MLALRIVFDLDVVLFIPAHGRAGEDAINAWIHDIGEIFQIFDGFGITIFECRNHKFDRHFFLAMG